MIKSEMFRGLIYAGETLLASTIQVEQTGPMQLRVKAGSFTTTDGSILELAEDQILDLEPSMVSRQVSLILGLYNGSVNLLLNEQLYGFEERHPPEEWRSTQILVLPFSIPAGATELPDIFVLSVLPGFPEGTGPEDWKVQGGVI